MNELKKSIHSWQRGAEPVLRTDSLAREEPLEFRLDTRPFMVTMRSPGHDRELAAGFLVSEGIVQDEKEIIQIRPYPRNDQGNVLDIHLSPETQVNLDWLKRHFVSSSSCGLCGKSSIEAVHRKFQPLRTPGKFCASTILELSGIMGRQQTGFGSTGGLHAAAVFAKTGKVVVLREDVGRHNAVDKVLGFGLLNKQLPYSRHVLLVSGRASFEIMQKALAARIPVVAAISAPSSLAVQFAQDSGQTLIGFLRGQKMNIYAGIQRLSFE